MLTQYELLLIAEFIGNGKLIPEDDSKFRWVFKDDKARREFAKKLVEPAIDEIYEKMSSVSFTMKY